MNTKIIEIILNSVRRISSLAYTPTSPQTLGSKFFTSVIEGSLGVLKNISSNDSELSKAVIKETVTKETVTKDLVLRKIIEAIVVQKAVLGGFKYA